MFFLFGLGALLIFILYHDSLFIPNAQEFVFLFGSSAAGVAGQYLLTYGFLYVTALEGSIISSSRILLAAAEVVKAGGLGNDISDLPAAGSAPDWMSEKAISIGHYFVASGVYTVFEPASKE